MYEDYDDIIDLPHHQSKTRPHMSNHSRAAQFAPFAALTGHSQAIDETARLTDSKMELDEYETAKLNDRLLVINNSENNEPISITYFVPDKNKSGGAYITQKGIVLKIREYEKKIVLDDGTEIPINDIVAIEGDQFDGADNM